MNMALANRKELLALSQLGPIGNSQFQEFANSLKSDLRDVSGWHFSKLLSSKLGFKVKIKTTLSDKITFSTGVGKLVYYQAPW